MIGSTAGAGRVGSGAPRILILAYHFAPSSASGTHRALHFARSLTDAGYDVRVITTSLDDVGAADPALEEVFPWPERITRVSRSPTVGARLVRIKKSARKPKGTSSRAPQSGSDRARQTPARGRRGYLRRHLAALDEFPDAQRGWLRPAVRAGEALGRERDISAVIASGPPWTAVVAGARVARRVGAPFIADFRDPWSPRSGATWRYESALAQRLAGLMEKRVVRTSRILLFNSPTLAERAAHGFGPQLAGRIRTILNGSAVPRRGNESPFPADDRLWLRHFGTLYAGRSIAPLLRGLRATDLPEANGAQIAVDLIGKVSEDLGRATGPDIVLRHRPALPFSEAVHEMERPAVLLVVQPPRLNGQIPTKLYDYLCTGNPILVLAPEESATWRIASRFSRARRLDPEPSERNRAVLARLLDDWRRGQLLQEASVEDTADLTKEAMGRELVAVVGEVIETADG